jgi:hypothetical protein
MEGAAVRREGFMGRSESKRMDCNFGLWITFAGFLADTDQ